MKKKRNRNINSCYYGEMLSVTKKNLYHYQIYHCLKVNLSFHEKLFQKENKKFYYGFMSCDFQFICGSMVNENHQSLASTAIPVLGIFFSRLYSSFLLIRPSPVQYKCSISFRWGTFYLFFFFHVQGLWTCEFLFYSLTTFFKIFVISSTLSCFSKVLQYQVSCILSSNGID